jgi:hypothetical protein
MRYPWANTLLLLLLLGQLLTGLGGLLSRVDNFSWVLWLHGLGGYALAVLLYWKGVIIFQVFKRRWRWTVERLAFIGLTLLLLTILATGWLWSYLGPLYLGGMSLMVLHGFLAVALIGLAHPGQVVYLAHSSLTQPPGGTLPGRSQPDWAGAAPGSRTG